MTLLDGAHRRRRPPAGSTPPSYAGLTPVGWLSVRPVVCPFAAHVGACACPFAQRLVVLRVAPGVVRSPVWRSAFADARGCVRPFTGCLVVRCPSRGRRVSGRAFVRRIGACPPARPLVSRPSSVGSVLRVAARLFVGLSGRWLSVRTAVRSQGRHLSCRTRIHASVWRWDPSSLSGLRTLRGRWRSPPGGLRGT